MSNPSFAYNNTSDEQITVDNLFKLANTIDLFEQYSRPHASQMARLAEALALRIGISGSDLNTLKIAALMHDVGEMIMDSPALRKGGLIDFKYKIELWRHPIIGEQQLAKRELPRQAQLLVRWHHEWWNGSGYPDMLRKETIPIGARILRLVDTYDSLTADRPYREAFSLEQAQNIIEKSAGIEFDPYLVKVFLEILSQISAPIIPKQSLAPLADLPTLSSLDLSLQEVQTEASEIQISKAPQKVNVNELENIEHPVLEPLITSNEQPSYLPTEETLPSSGYESTITQDESPTLQEEVKYLVAPISNLETETPEFNADLGTQPLFVPTSDPNSVSNTGYFSESSFKEQIEEGLNKNITENITEDINTLSSKSEETILDKSQEYVENKSE